MEFVLTQTYLSDILHSVSQALLVPDIVLLLAFILYSIFCIGSIIVEACTERHNFKIAMPEFLAALTSADQDDIARVIQESALLNRQKIAMLTVFDYRILSGDALIALIKRLVSNEDMRFTHVTSRNDMAAKIAPMLGLMGTLIPLGPGVAALGTGDIAQLSSSIIIAFDTTVAGLATAIVCLTIGRIRRNWYEDYMTALDSSMATLLEKIEDMRARGDITGTDPTDYAAEYAISVKGKRAQEQARRIANESMPVNSADTTDQKPEGISQHNVIEPAGQEA